MVDGKTIFITGCGSLATALAQELLLSHRPKKIILFSRDEYLQEVTKEKIESEKVRYFIGDVRDEKRLLMATRGVDYLIHTAALKRIDSVEYNPGEAVRTNIIGTLNVISAAIANNIKRATFIGTDKAVMPINLYGGTKFVGEKLWVHSNFYKPIFNCVRYANVLGSRGSVLPLFKKCADSRSPFPITDERMTRFGVAMAEAVKLVIMAMEAEEGYTYVLKSRTFRIVDLARALYGRAKFHNIGMRPSEKIHETLIGEHETTRVEDRGWYMAIQPEIHYAEREWPATQEMAQLISKDGNMTLKEVREWLAKLN